MDSAASLLSPRSSPSSPFAFSPPASPSSASCSPSSSSTASSSFSFSPLRSPRPLSSSPPLRSAAAAGFPDLDPSSIWGAPRPFTTPLQQPPPFRHRSPAISVTNYASTTTAEPSPSPALSWPSTPHRTHYTLLGVSPRSSPQEIRTAYRKLALQHHPDVSPLHQLDTSTKLFAEINEAYTTLSDPQKKACYDLKLALESPRGAMEMETETGRTHSAPSPRKYTDASTGRVYPSMNSFYREWRRGHA